MPKNGNSKRKEWKEYDGIHPDRMHKFSYDKPGELKLTLNPQCANCIHSKGIDCKVYGRKPKKYLNNEESCPEYEVRRST